MSLGELAKSKGFTMTELAKQTGITQEYLSKLSNHKQKNPTYKVLKKMANVLGVSVEEVGDIIIKDKEIC